MTFYETYQLQLNKQILNKNGENLLNLLYSDPGAYHKKLRSLQLNVSESTPVVDENKIGYAENYINNKLMNIDGSMIGFPLGLAKIVIQALEFSLDLAFTLCKKSNRDELFKRPMGVFIYELFQAPLVLAHVVLDHASFVLASITALLSTLIIKGIDATSEDCNISHKC